MTVNFLIQEQLDDELAVMHQPIKAVRSLSRLSIISIIALVVSTLIVMSGWVFY